MMALGGLGLRPWRMWVLRRCMPPLSSRYMHNAPKNAFESWIS